MLALYVREWILNTFGQADGALQSALTSNHFLSRFGAPTEVEARIGVLYRRDGLAAAQAWLEAEFIPAMVRHIKKHHPALAGKLPAGS